MKVYPAASPGEGRGGMRQPKTNGQVDGDGVQRLGHELGVHKAELEAQDEELKRVQQELQESRDRYRELFDRAPVGYLRISHDGVILEANDAAAGLLGMTRQTLRQATLTAYVAPRSQDTFYLCRQRVLETAGEHECEVEMLKADGAAFWVLLRGAPEKGADRKTPGLHVALVDITARKGAEDRVRQLNEEIARRNAELEAANKELEEFARVASHDLREPLRTVTSFSQLLQRRYQDIGTEAREFIGFIVDGAARMQNMMDGLLAYARAAAARKPCEPTSMESVLGDVMANLKAATDECKAEITHDPLPTIEAEPTQMTHVMQNLIGNAVKFRGEAIPRIHVSARQQTAEWVFSVKDNGIGIDPSLFDSLFVLFRRLQPVDKYPGAGVGLAIVKKLVQRHGGRVWVESQPGKGSTFYFSIPMSPGEVCYAARQPA